MAKERRKVKAESLLNCFYNTHISEHIQDKILLHFLFNPGVAVLAGYLVTARASRKCQKTLVQSQLNKNRVDQENLILDSGESVAKSTVVEVISEVQESTPTADQLISESGNINWKSTKYGDVMG